MEANTRNDLPGHRTYGLLVVPLLLGVLGCSAESEQLGAVTQRAITHQDYTDGSGLIQMRLTTCDLAVPNSRCSSMPIVGRDGCVIALTHVTVMAAR